MTNRQILLVEKPQGKLAPQHFKLVQGAMPEPKDGEAAVSCIGVSAFSRKEMMYSLALRDSAGPATMTSVRPLRQWIASCIAAPSEPLTAEVVAVTTGR